MSGKSALMRNRREELEVADAEDDSGEVEAACEASLARSAGVGAWREVQRLGKAQIAQPIGKARDAGERRRSSAARMLKVVAQ